MRSNLRPISFRITPCPQQILWELRRLWPAYYLQRQSLLETEEKRGWSAVDHTSYKYYYRNMNGVESVEQVLKPAKLSASFLIVEI